MMEWVPKIFRIAARWPGNVRALAASSDLPDFLYEGKRSREPEHDDILMSTNFLRIPDSRISELRCLRGRDEDWLSFIGCSGHDMGEQNWFRGDQERNT